MGKVETNTARTSMAKRNAERQRMVPSTDFGLQQSDDRSTPQFGDSCANLRRLPSGADNAYSAF
jgi:hypothetical protein